MDDPARYPALIHCKAGLHRTGVLSAVYRMEYQRWDWLEAWHELRSHGFGEFVSDSSNDYILQYLLAYRPGLRLPATGDRTDAATVDPFALARNPVNAKR